MPFRPSRNETQDEENELYREEEFLLLLDRELERAASESLPYSAVICTVRRLPDEDVGGPVERASRFLPGLVRSDDIAGCLGDSILVVGLRDTDRIGAEAFASRLIGDVALQTAHLGAHTWEAGQASFPADGGTSQELIQSAIDATVDSRHAWKGSPSIAPEKMLKAAADAVRAERDA